VVLPRTQSHRNMSSSDRAQDGRHPVGGSNPDRHQRRAHLDKDRQALKAVQTKMKAIMACVFVVQTQTKGVSADYALHTTVCCFLQQRWAE